MSYRHTLEAVLESLHEIESLVKGFPENGNIYEIEIDLAMQKIRNLYELMLMMKKDEFTIEVGKKPAAAAAAAVMEEKKPAVAAAEAVKEEKKPSAAVAAKKTSGSQTIADQFKGGATIHESLHHISTKEEDTLARAIPVTNLLTAIGINDRFTFTRELFNNDNALFENAIQQLNSASSFNDAYNYMIQQFTWDMDSETVQMLLDLVRRKYIKGKHE